MKSFAVGLVAVWCGAASLFVTTTCANAASAAEEVPPVDQLPAACRAAKADFHPLTRADLQEVRAELLEAVARLDRRLRAAGDNGADWRKYLRWDRMQDQLQGGKQPDLAVLDAVYRRYTAGHEGLKLIWFADVREALRRYRLTARAIDQPKVRTDYEHLVEGLPAYIQAYDAKPTAELALEIGNALRWLEDRRQAPGLVRAVRQRFVRPNLLLEVSADLVAAGIAGPVDETEPVHEIILGTDIYGTGHTMGRTSVEFSPDERRGVVDTVFLGTTKTRNIGYNGPVRIYSNGTTRIGARKRLLISATGLGSLPTVSDAVTKTEITSIRSNRGLRCVERIAWRRVCKQKHEAECIASHRAERRINDRIDAQAAEAIGRANEAFVEKFRKPLLRHKLFPQQLRFSTTDTALHVVTLQADASQLGAPTVPPESLGPRDLALQMHESMINNLATSALAGMTLRDETLKAALVELLGELPEPLKSDEDQEPWAIAFARRQPISVAFAEDKFSVTIRGRRYYKGEESYPGMHVTAVYKIAKTEQGFKAIREGDLRVFPPGFVPGSGRKLSPREMVIRTLLERRFGKIFKEEMIGEGFVLPGKWSEAGKMKPVQLVCEAGWLTIAWKRAPADDAIASTR